MTQIEIRKGDITKIDVDVVVNAANKSLLGGGGVDGAIHRAAGPELLRESKTLGGCETGKAKITGGYNLPANFIIHTVGPIWHGGEKNEAYLLRSCYQNALELAIDNNCKTIAFPAISTGVFGYPLQEATKIAIDTIKNYCENNEDIEKVIFICFDSQTYQTYQDYYSFILEEKKITNKKSTTERTKRKKFGSNKSIKNIFSYLFNKGN